MEYIYILKLKNNKYKTNKQKYYNNKSCGICGKKGHREVNCDYF